jgi:hypothetical protein
MLMVLRYRLESLKESGASLDSFLQSGKASARREEKESVDWNSRGLERSDLKRILVLETSPHGLHDNQRCE